MIMFIDQATYDSTYTKFHKCIKKYKKLVKVQCKIDNIIMRKKYGESCMRFLKLRKFCVKKFMWHPKKKNYGK